MLKYFPEGSFDNPYKAVGDFLSEYIMTHENYYSDLIVSIETENLGRSNEYCSCNGDFLDFYFDDDWYEGGWIKVYGYVHLDDVQVPEMEDEDKKAARVLSNEEKFEEVFGISFHEFVIGLKREDQSMWGISEYKEPPCED